MATMLIGISGEELGSGASTAIRLSSKAGNIFFMATEIVFQSNSFPYFKYCYQV